MIYKYFSQTDFNNATPSCSIEDMEPALLELLDEAREVAGIPFIINSAYRSVEHEHEQGRDGSSSHTKGLAVDIRTTTSRERFLILSAVLRVGFKRIGIGENFIHVDIDKEKPEMLVWGYY